jgi:HAD superfamily hydrolase (TIGR01509 family)
MSTHSTNRPTAIFFDFDETLAENRIPIQDLFAAMYHEFSEQIGTENREAFFSALRGNAGQLWNTMFETSEQPEDQFRRCFKNSVATLDRFDDALCNNLGDNMFDRFLELSSNNVQLHDGAEETIEALKNQGIITGIITNGIEALQLGKIHRLGLQEQVDHVIVSAQARAHKPHASVFQFALSKAGVPANGAWQVGDHPTNDVAGAIRAGMSGVFYDPSANKLEEAFKELEETPTFTIHHLNEVIEIIDFA